jgi:hypothetical protein
MKNFLKTSVALMAITAGLMSMNAQAALVAQDYKTTNDKLITYDNVTNLSWLKLTQTVGMSINQVKAEFAAGGRFEGWRLPTDDEVESIVRAAMSPLAFNEDATLYNGSGYRGYTANWRTWFGTTYYTSSGDSSNGNKYWYSYGLYEGSAGNTEMSGTYYRDKNSFGTHTYYATLYDDYVSGTTYTSDFKNGQYGVFLVKIRPEDTPKPPTETLPGDGSNVNDVPVAGFGLLAAMGLLFRRRK